MPPNATTPTLTFTHLNFVYLDLRSFAGDVHFAATHRATANRMASNCFDVGSVRVCVKSRARYASTRRKPIANNKNFILFSMSTHTHTNSHINSNIVSLMACERDRIHSNADGTAAATVKRNRCNKKKRQCRRRRRRQRQRQHQQK